MADIKSFPNNQDEYVGAEYAMRWLHGRTSGVFGAQDNARVSAVPSEMAVEISDGIGWISNSEANGIVWWISNQAEAGKKLKLEVPLADGARNRIDRVVISWDTVDYVALPKVEIIKGTPADSPKPPELVNNTLKRQISLAQISVKKAVTSITLNDITDERMNPAVCGIVTEKIEVDTTEMTDRFEAWFETVKGQLDGDVAANLQRQILDTNEKLTKILGYSKAGTVHQLTGLEGLPGIVEVVFSPTDRYTVGDTMTIDGTPYTIQLSNGDLPDTKLFVAGTTIQAVVDARNKKINFKSAGGAKLPAGTVAINKVFMNNGTYTVPVSGRYRVTVIGQGGGGGSGHTNGGYPTKYSGGGGGGAGGVAQKSVNLLEGQKYQVTVNQATVSFGKLISATTGATGENAMGYGQFYGKGGVGGIGKGGDINYRGGNGLNGQGSTQGGAHGGEGGTYTSTQKNVIPYLTTQSSSGWDSDGNYVSFPEKDRETGLYPFGIGSAGGGLREGTSDTGDLPNYYARGGAPGYAVVEYLGKMES